MKGGHERSDANIRNIAWFTLGLLAVIVVVLFAMDRLFHIFAERKEAGPPPSPLARERVLPPAPRLQIDGASDLKTFESAERQVLSSYGWVNAKEGIVRIPIDRAMDLVAAKGLPARSKPEELGIQ